VIKFFRQIRQKLLQENRLSKYLLYAIGEIILVMIGILLALQVNNWNEKRKTEQFELQLLHSFKTGLQADLSDIKINVTLHQRGLTAADSLLFYLENGGKYDIERASRYFADMMIITYFRYSTSAFETLKSNGINTIENQQLRDKVIEVYDSQYTFFLTYQKTFIAEIERGFTEVFSTRFVESFKYDLTKNDLPGELRPLNFEALKTDNEFLYYTKSLRNRIRILLDWQYNRLESRVKELVIEIDKEIEKKKSK